MKGWILGLILTLSLHAYAQKKQQDLYIGAVISDTSTFIPAQFKEALPDIRKSENFIEIRFIYEPYNRSYSDYTVISYQKKWTGVCYTSNNDTLTQKPLNAKINYDSLLNKLVALKLFFLPDASSLPTGELQIDRKHGSYTQSGGGVSHPECYYIEFKAGESFRRYHYCNPEFWYELTPQVIEFSHATEIVNIFKQLSNDDLIENNDEY